MERAAPLVVLGLHGLHRRVDVSAIASLRLDACPFDPGERDLSGVGIAGE